MDLSLVVNFEKSLTFEERRLHYGSPVSYLSFKYFSKLRSDNCFVAQVKMGDEPGYEGPDSLNLTHS